MKARVWSGNGAQEMREGVGWRTEGSRPAGGCPGRSGLKTGSVRSGGVGKLFTVALVLAVLEGAVRKWLLGMESGYGGYLAYFSKDAFFCAVLVFGRGARVSGPMRLFRGWLIAGTLLFVVGGAVSVAYGFNWVGACLTMRAVVLLPWVALLASERLGGYPVRKAALILGGLTVVNAGLSAVQNRFPAEHILNRYSTGETEVVALETGVRATGTYSYITGLAVMSSVGVWGGLVLVSVAGGDRRVQAAGTVSIASGFGCALASVSRGPLVVGFVMVGLWCVLGRPKGRGSVGALLVMGCLVLLGAWAAGAFPSLARLANAVVERHESSEETVWDRTFSQVAEGAKAVRQLPLGGGLGTEQVAANYARTQTRSFTTYENQFPRLIVESGVIGFLGFIVICIGGLLALESAKRCAGDPCLRAALTATQLLLIPLFYGNAVFNHTGSAFAWMIFAIALAQIRTPPGPNNKSSARRRHRSRSSAH